MSAGHAIRLYRPGTSPVHGLTAPTKLLAALGFVILVVLTPRELFWAFGLYAAGLATVAAIARVPAALIARRMLVETPFVAFAVLLPFLAVGARTDVLGVQVSVEGLWAAWNLLAKATLGVVSSILLAATTPMHELLAGLQRLRMPRPLVEIMGFMLRYADVITDELRRMRIARESRGFRARDARQLAVVAHGAGALFVRSYERGERVHLAMLSRGHSGFTPPGDQGIPVQDAPRGQGAPRDQGIPVRSGPSGDTATGPGTTPSRQIEPSLQITGLTFAYPDGHPALHGVDLSLERGERVALLGPNGAGKTTLVLHLNGILTGGHGRVRVGGLDVAAAHLKEIRRRVGIVFQDPDDQLFMPTVRQDIAFGLRNLGLAGAELDERVAEALCTVRLQDLADRPPYHLSYGQRRRAALAGVLAMRPEVLVLDEPSSNLDPAGRRELAEVLAALDVTVLMVTHDLPYALQLCPRSVILSAGRVVADAPTAELLADTDLLAAHRLELPFGFTPPPVIAV